MIARAGNLQRLRLTQSTAFILKKQFSDKSSPVMVSEG
jgi:hypothetical protein